jgi:hypothetical protein
VFIGFLLIKASKRSVKKVLIVSTLSKIKLEMKSGVLQSLGRTC